MAVERAKTGNKGFDELVGGGLPRGRTILLAGGSGTGKTIFATQFLYNGAQMGEPGVHLTLEEKPGNIRNEMKEFGMDLAKMEKADKLAMIDASLVRLGLESDEKFTLSPENFDINHLVQNLIMTARNIGAKRVVIDALPSLDVLLDGDIAKIRNAVIELNYLLQENGLTSILLDEIPSGKDSYSRHDVEEFVVDGVIVLNKVEALDKRSIAIMKMRQTNHELKPQTMSINHGDGIIIEGESQKSSIL
jgi:KaiC/GvpD/RAD55 family RecA-like ATPase